MLIIAYSDNEVLCVDYLSNLTGIIIALVLRLYNSLFYDKNVIIFKKINKFE